MVLTGRLPQISHVPELQIFRCSFCSTAMTLEVGKFARKTREKPRLSGARQPHRVVRRKASGILQLVKPHWQP
jgi:hypothetical protein